MHDMVCLLRALVEEQKLSQRALSMKLGFSLGKTNGLVKKAMHEGYLSPVPDPSGGNMSSLTEEGTRFLAPYQVDNAIILAAGFGSRFVPLTYDTPKGLLPIEGVPMIERQITQLRDAGIPEIILVVGYLMEKFDYLVDKYGVTLVYNPEYATKNNFASLYRAASFLRNSYILVADNWIETSIFHRFEPRSWLSCTYFSGKTKEWGVKTGANGRIVEIKTEGENTWALNGPAYFDVEMSHRFAGLLEIYYRKTNTENCYWEDILRENLSTLSISINKQEAQNIYEFETLEDLRAYDPHSGYETDNRIMQTIAHALNVRERDIHIKGPLTASMTNSNFLFEVGGVPYVFREPGIGTDQLIDRKKEKKSYELIQSLNLSDEVIFFEETTGEKITKYYPDTRLSDPLNPADVEISMTYLRKIHAADLPSPHKFDIGKMIDLYEGLARDLNAILFSDYVKVREEANELLAFRDALGIPECLCHIDFIYANVLHLPDDTLRIIDWEYSGAADPLIDIAMWSLYAYYDRTQAEHALFCYLKKTPSRQQKARLYLYLALGGFLWSLWGEYKQGLGETFGEYSIRMYRYMKEYYKILKDEKFMEVQE